MNKRMRKKHAKYAQTEEGERAPIMVIHVYREENGEILVSEQAFYNHTIHPTPNREQAFVDFWRILLLQLDQLAEHESQLGGSLHAQLVYLRHLQEMNII